MSKIWIALIIWSIGFDVVLWRVYRKEQNIFGRTLAHQTLRYWIMLMCFAPAVSIITLLFFGDHALDVLLIIYASFTLFVVCIRTYLCSRDDNKGKLLLDVGGNDRSRKSFWLSLFIALISTASILFIAQDITLGFSQGSLWRMFPVNFLNLSVSISCMLIGLGKLEFRKYGIRNFSSYILWQRIKAYRWIPSKPNLLAIQFDPLVPFFPSYMGLFIPLEYHDQVIRILEEQLPHAGQ